MLRVITAKFASTCAETGRPIKKGDVCVFDTVTRRVYASGSPTQQRYQRDNRPHAPNLDEILEQQSEQWSRENL